MNFTLYKKITLFLLTLTLGLFLSLPLLAATTKPCETNQDGKVVYCQLEGSAFEVFTDVPKDADPLGTFLAQAFQFGLAAAAALAVLMIVWGGVEIMLSESMFKKEDGRKKINDAIWGLLLALVSWLILYIINPEILNFKL
jgi:hypothetical protein